MENIERPIENHEKRVELIGALEELSDIRLQISLWINHDDYPNSYGINEIFHLLFDDTELGNDPSSEIGRILKDEAEVEKIAVIATHLQEIYERLGDVESASFMNDEKWDSVTLSAKEALATIAPSETKIDRSEQNG